MKESCFKSCFWKKEGFTQKGSDVVICPPCGESVAGATKEGQNRKKALWPLLPRLTAVLPPQGREMSSGFTLIELLVVVLIIGILAAVAVPQYTKAVRKARIAEAKVLLKSLVDASDMFYLENPGFEQTASNESLNIEVPSDTKNWTIGIDECLRGVNGKVGCTAVADPKWESGYDIRYYSPNYEGGPEESEDAGKFACFDYNNTGICSGLSSHLVRESVYEL